MMRILHSLPRTHKLLLLPVATMVTVLGAHKIATTYEDMQRDNQPLDTVLVPLENNATPGLPSLELPRSPVASAIDRALDATRNHVPISQLQAQEFVDVDFIDSAAEYASFEANMRSSTGNSQPLILKTGVASSTEAAPISDGSLALDDGARHVAIVIGTVAGGMLESTANQVAEATSYEDVSDDELELFDEGPIVLTEEIAADTPYVPTWQTYRVQQGDTFAALAEHSLGLGYREAMALLDQVPDKNILTRWRIGDTFEYQLDEDGHLLALRLMENVRDGYLIERDSIDSDFEVASIERAGEASQRLYAGTVSGSFTRSAQAAGLSSAEVSEMARVLEKKLDFRRDTRRGDEFRVLVESDIIDGQRLDPRVLAVSYEGERMDLTLVRNPEDNHFYSPDGESLDPAFDRYPFSGHYRISSNFNLNRRHPITGRTSPHKGTDFAMPIGTSVVAPANGTVEMVGNHPLAGRYIVVRHDNGYKTRYLHLSQPLVSTGERVTMGEQIARSGNTGRSTGPHLHYEIMVNNNQVDAMRVALPENRSLQGTALASFQEETAPAMAALMSGEPGSVVAVASAPAEGNADEGS
ncbi:peptidoglycan DD-metalloendopeptidase family protein [Halomonas cupida]|uniref:peptidoglycan DD-metalloendopeptidase family protein n=1 Tax=Halomonas cupida TaxID=44933 RepID=UPI003A946340